MLPPVSGEMSENSRVHWATASLPGRMGALSCNLKVERQDPLNLGQMGSGGLYLDNSENN